MALHSRDADTVFTAVATRSRAYCSSMEDRRCKYLITFFLNWITGSPPNAVREGGSGSGGREGMLRKGTSKEGT